jgi:hypothetical protein
VPQFPALCFGCFHRPPAVGLIKTEVQSPLGPGDPKSVYAARRWVESGTVSLAGCRGRGSPSSGPGVREGRHAG